MQPSNDGKPRNCWLVTILSVLLVNWIMKQGQLDTPIAKNIFRVSKWGKDGLEPISTVAILGRSQYLNCSGTPVQTVAALQAHT